MPASIRLLTYNLFLRPPGIHSDGGDFKWDRMHQFAETELGLFDVVAVQECFAFGTSRRSELVRLASKAGLGYHCACPVPGWLSLSVDGGLLILSRMPITATDFLRFPRGTHSDWWVSHTNVTPEPTHLAAGDASYEQDPPMDSPALQIRLAQLRAVSAFVAAKATAHASGGAAPLVLLVGDLNVNGRASRSDGMSHSEEYLAATEALSGKHGGSAAAMAVEDLAYTALGEHPVTTGTIGLAQQDPENKCLDYIIRLTPVGASAGEAATDVSFADVGVEPFKVQGKPYTHLRSASSFNASAPGPAAVPPSIATDAGASGRASIHIGVGGRSSPMPSAPPSASAPYWPSLAAWQPTHAQNEKVLWTHAWVSVNYWLCGAANSNLRLAALSLAVFVFVACVGSLAATDIFGRVGVGRKPAASQLPRVDTSHLPSGPSHAASDDAFDRRILSLGLGSPLVGSLPPEPSTPSRTPWAAHRHYAVIIDSGSSGSRVLLYSWKDPRAPLGQNAGASGRGLRPVLLEKADERGEHFMHSVSPGQKKARSCRCSAFG
nr:hypothetical protein HK105_007018 [Polyrhizophydium stewartii]